MMHPSKISIADYTYELPDKRIAKYPLPNRDDSKLLVFRNGNISDEVFKKLPDLLPQNSLLVFNESSVLRSRLNFVNAQKQPIEIFCLEPHRSTEPGTGLLAKNNVYWNCIVGNLKRWKEDTLVLNIGEIELKATIAQKKEGYVVVEFIWSPSEKTFAEVLDAAGKVPIPPYLKREADETDQERYQTLYSKNPGSVAAPTAGLHFTGEILSELQSRQVNSLNVTLHVGAGTFLPVKSELLEEHEMHSEWLSVDRHVIETLLHRCDDPIIAVGTTSLRTIESLYWLGIKTLQDPQLDMSQTEVGQWEPYEFNLDMEVNTRDSLKGLLEWMNRHSRDRIMCRTSILIAPPYELKVASGILTNFHQPQSTLLLLVAAIVGDRWKEIYDFALKNDYRFLSYGDSSLLLK